MTEDETPEAGEESKQALGLIDAFSLKRAWSRLICCHLWTVKWGPLVGERGFARAVFADAGKPEYSNSVLGSLSPCWGRH